MEWKRERGRQERKRQERGGDTDSEEMVGRT